MRFKNPILSIVALLTVAGDAYAQINIGILEFRSCSGLPDTAAYELLTVANSPQDFLAQSNAQGARGFRYMYDGCWGSPACADTRSIYVRDSGQSSFSYEALVPPASFADFITQANAQGARGFQYTSESCWGSSCTSTRSIYVKNNAKPSTYSYEALTRAPSFDAFLSQANSQGARGYQYTYENCFTSACSDMRSIYVRDNSRNSSFSYRAVPRSSTMALLAQANAQGAQGFGFMYENCFDPLCADSRWLYAKDNSSTAQCSYEVMPLAGSSSAFASQANSEGAKGYVYMYDNCTTGACSIYVKAGAAQAPPPQGNTPGALSGLWWNAQESGWGIHFTQRRNLIFAAWYTYDASGNPKWYVASSCQLPSGNTGTSGSCSGPLYEVSGSAFFGRPFDPSAVKVAQVGTLQVTFSSADTALMAYTVGNQSRTIPITRQVFATGGSPPAVDYTDLWWNVTESGWGMAISHQLGVMFLAWYVYDDSGRPTWYVASNCVVSGDGCSGTLYRTTGPAFGATFNSSQVQVFAAGNTTLTFRGPNDATLTYSVNGVTSSKTITRQLF